jgi:hypothetical protein
MNRERVTRQIERIVHAIEDEEFPAAVKEFYVFGSYARGALNPGDLDLILIHDSPCPDFMLRLQDELIEKYGDDDFYWPRGMRPERQFEKQMRAVVRRPGEKMDILLATSTEKVEAMGENIAKAHRVLIWSKSNRQWRENLASIKPDPSVGRHERAHFADLRRFKGDLRMMLNVTEAISQGYLKLTRIDAGTVDPILNPLYRHWYDHWVKCRVMGKESMKLLQHGLWWMQQQRGQRWEHPQPPDHDGTMCSRDRVYAVYFGNPPLYAVHRVFAEEHGYKRICLIPHFKRDQPNEMFAFERGGRTSLKSFAAIMHRL